jgi:hypothetical protein
MKAIKRATGERHSSPKVYSHMEVKGGENGGHVVTHHFHPGAGGEYHKPEDHVFGDSEGQEAANHIVETAGIKMQPSESEGEEMGQTDEEA